MTKRASYRIYLYRFFFMDKNEEIYDVKEEREVSNEFYAASYAFDWLYKFEYKYGKCVKIIVTEKDNPHNILLNIEREKGLI